ncbi:MAG TPA: CDP-alcohol phosphatidyltransferase family protein [Acidimicrobiia bacterium]|nr:CDP-alcohol phosphatidyltransferase family protein [Acidimicrobiia bacterium]
MIVMVKGRILTIPNVITIARLIFLVPFVFITLNSPITGAIIAAVIGFTDYLDGWIARHFHQESELGRILDPIADRTLTFTSFIVFIVTGTLPLWFAIVVGIRELAVSLGTLVIFRKKTLRLDVNYVGKVSAFGVMAATPSWVMAHEVAGNAHTGWTVFAGICTIIAIPTGYYSLIEYVRAYRRA